MISLNEIESHIIDSNPMNTKLLQLYSGISRNIFDKIEKYNKSDEALPTYQMTNPYLITASQYYYEAPIKIMFICKETNGWLGEVNNGLFTTNNIPNRLMNLYDIYSKNGEDTKYGPWALYKEFKAFYQSKPVEFIMNNLNFIGYLFGNKGTNPNIEKDFDSILKEEIEICKPNLIVFFTHNEYDSIIERKLGKANFSSISQQFTDEQFAEINLETPLYKDLKIFRTYHPQHLLRFGKNNGGKEIIQLIKSEIDNLLPKCI